MKIIFIIFVNLNIFYKLDEVKDFLTQKLLHI
ncbi:hypothetical protein SAMN05421785_1249 [Chryseobacterium gambrini]|uniref:Uncharacterized protein n=1 Tax=Chryseobacterium gambrini TaxID=373672 RepID=A0A1N7QZU4_9FLAO|nr:hypothetical protein SAMN05421785_1249 [Chryseobacterium gambrini]